jgi:hypothetical protein
MRFELRILCGLAMLLTVPAIGGAVSSTPTVQLVVPTINYPGTGVTGTRAAGINNHLDLVFDLDTANGPNSEMGFIPHGGKPIAPTLDPNAPNLTAPDAINISQTIVGDYRDASLLFHGFTYSGGVFTTFDVSVSGAFNTALFGINDAGDLAGEYELPTPSPFLQAFVQIGGVETDVHVTGAVGSYVSAINNADLAVGSYSTTDPFVAEATCGCHGFVRLANGNIGFFDPTGSVSTVLKGLNNRAIVVGRYYDSLGALHGFVYLIPSKTSITYDYPGAKATSLNGINDADLIAGRYTDSSNVAHGFIARLK